MMQIQMATPNFRIWKALFVLSVGLLLSCSQQKQKPAYSYLSHKMLNGTLVIQSIFGEVRLTPLPGEAIEVHYLQAGIEQLPSFSKADDLRVTHAETENSDKTIKLRNGGLSAVIDKSDLSINFYRQSELLVRQKHYFLSANRRGFDFELDDTEKILGGGERVLGMNRRNQRMPLYNRAHYGYGTHSEQMYFSLPVIMSSKKYTILFDNSARGFLDIAKTEKNTLTFEAVGGRTAYIVFTAETYPELISNYVAVTGRQPLPPRWAFGNFASRFGYHTEEEVRYTVDKFHYEGFPLDAVILDLYWYGPDIQGHVGNLDWDKTAFPTPVDMIADFNDKGVKTILITQPFVLSSSKKWQDAKANKILTKNVDGTPSRFDFYFGNTGLIDVFDEDARQWFWSAYENLFNQGVAGTWGDLGEPEMHPDDTLHYLSDFQMHARGEDVHNVFGHRWAKMVYQKQQELQADTRPFIMMRAGFAGSQRYGMIPWSGDVDRSWDGLKPQVELSLQMGLLGLAYTHSDLGGFAGGEVFDQEMYIRWLQYGVFQPIYRPHAQEHIAPEPVFHDQQTRDILRKFIKLRYRLLPYIYTLAYQNSTSGMPLMRPLFFEDEADVSLFDIKDEYLWGDAFLVSPIVNPGEMLHSIKLPEGIWFDYWDDSRYQGGRTVEIPVSLATFPVMVRAGSFIPMVDAVSTTKDYSSDKLILHYYADESVTQSSGIMFEDDGSSSHSIKNKKYEILRFHARQEKGMLEIDLSREAYAYPSMPKSRSMEIIVHNFELKPTRLSLAGADLKPKTSAVELMAASQGYYYDPGSKQLTVRFNWQHNNTRLSIQTAYGKPVIYQVFTRLFGNQNSRNKPWGTIAENGVGKFNDFTDVALSAIKEFGVSHIWYTGVPHHALVGDYSAYGISDDDPDVVKGRAGSPYAIKDYYNVNPDLAVDPERRLEEFKALIERTHQQGMKVIIDIVPNHIARNYQSLSKPEGHADFGEHDDVSVEYSRNNNFYYILGEDFKVPLPKNAYQPLGGEPHPLVDGEFIESPAKWTGNNSRKSQPDADDWYETVKVNYGVRPDGSYDFPRLASAYRNKDYRQHYQFWNDKDVPDSWKKMRNIVLYWTDFGVDGFRYDMAEMVPVEFWSYLNSAIKNHNPDATLIAEVYNPALYRDYIYLGKMDYLYDKVDFYDSIKLIMQGKADTTSLLPIIDKMSDINRHMLHFLENHDEQRIASPVFAGDAAFGKPAMVVSTLIGKAPTLLFYAQALGESGEGNAGFGGPSRTTIFDYWGVPSLQRWMNAGKFDGANLSTEEKSLRDFYVKLLSFSATSAALNGDYADLHKYNLENTAHYTERLFSFARWNQDEKLIVLANFSSKKSYRFSLRLPDALIEDWGLADGEYYLDDMLAGNRGANHTLIVVAGKASISVELKQLESKVFKLLPPVL